MNKFLNIKFGVISIDILTLPAIFCAFFLGYADLFLISFASVLIHELSHILCAKSVGVSVSRAEIHPFGVCAVLKDGYINNSEKEFIITFVGPFTSLAITMLSIILDLPYREYIFDINLCICAINLLPVLPLDGGRMIKSMLTYKMGILRAYNFSRNCSKALIFLLIPLSILILIKTGFNFSCILITAFLLGNIYDEQKNITLITLREILENPTKTEIIKRTKIYCASDKEKARKLLRLISYDYFIIINITKGGKIIATLTEDQVLSALLEKGVDISFSQILTQP